MSIAREKIALGSAPEIARAVKPPMHLLSGHESEGCMPERGDGFDHIVPRLRRGQPRHVEMMGAALGVEEHRRRELRGECGLADALGAEDHGFLWSGDSPGEDLEFGHDGLCFVLRELDVPPAPNGAALPEAKTSGVSRCARLPRPRTSADQRRPAATKNRTMREPARTKLIFFRRRSQRT